MNNYFPLVSVFWLKENLGNSKLLLLEANLKSPINLNEQKRCNTVIPGAMIFNIEDDFSDEKNILPHTMLNEDNFSKAAQKLGINNDSLIVVYDTIGIYSSPRVWWMFKAMGLEEVYVLNGGLPAWENQKFNCDHIYKKPLSNGNFIAKLNPLLIINSLKVLEAITTKNETIIDARSEERFYGKIEEPRKGLRKGHIPTAINIPFNKLLDGNMLKDENNLVDIFNDIPKENRLIFSCGSGVTACINALAACIAGFEKISVYDGSWSEWGMNNDLPITIQ